MLRRGNKGACPPNTKVTIDVKAPTCDCQPGITESKNGAVESEAGSIGSTGQVIDSNGEKIDPRISAFFPSEATANLDYLVCLVEKHSSNPSLNVHSSQVPQINEFKQSGSKAFPNASNLVFTLGDNVCKFILLSPTARNFYLALIMEVNAVMHEPKCQYWVQANGLFLTDSHLCIVMPKMIVMSDFARTMSAQRQSMPCEVLASMIYDWLQGIKALEDKNLLHNDIKAANLLLDGLTGVAKLADFGSVGKHNPVGAYTAIHGLPADARCTLLHCIPFRIDDTETKVCSKFDVLSLALAALESLLGGENPVFALKALKYHSLPEKERAFSETLKAHQNLLQSLEDEGKLPKNIVPPLRTVLQQSTINNPSDRISPSKAIELLETSVRDREQVRAFVEGVLMPPKKACKDASR